MATQASGRPTTRSSFRQTLGLTNMGRAFQDVMHGKDEKPKKVKEAKTSKEKEKERDNGSSVPSRRTSIQAGSIPTRSAVPRPSVSERPVSVAASLEHTVVGTSARRMATRSQKLVATSSTSADDSSNTAPIKVASPDMSVTSLTPTLEKARISGLRPRPAGSGTIGSSGLPKFRPQSITSDPQRKASPVRASTRRKLSSSDDSLLDTTSGSESGSPRSRGGRAISPLPKRAAYKLNVGATNHTAPATPPASLRSKDAARGSQSRSPSQPPSKHAKKSTPPPTSMTTGAPLARSSSNASGSAVRLTRTSSTSKAVRSIFGFGQSKPTEPATATAIKPPKRAATPQGQGSVRGSVPAPTPVRQPRGNKPAMATPDGSSTPMAASMIADQSNDSFDVNMMLSMVSPTAPTPAMPRVVVGGGQFSDPETPTRKAETSYHSNTLVLTPEGSVSHLRPSDKLSPGRDRGSLTLEQLAASSVHGFAPGEEHMLAAISAPFASRSVSGAMSPTFGPLDLVPESPAIGGFAMLSPGQSLSQILLPEMTPSPAPRQKLYDAAIADMPPPQSGEAVMLRLQVAQIENLAKERMMAVQDLERDLDMAHDVRKREAKEMNDRLATLEEQLQNNLHIHDNVQSEQISCIAALEAEVASVKASSKRDINAAVSSVRKELTHAATRDMQQAKMKLQLANCADATAARWAMVMDIAEAELELVESGKETLAVFLVMLESTLAQARAE